MGTAQLPFSKRMTRLNRQRRRMRENGIIHSINHDGLIVARARRRTPNLPLKGLILLVAAVMMFKAFLFVELGPRVYEQRVAELAQGSVVEQGGAWLMQADPVTRHLARGLSVMLP